MKTGEVTVSINGIEYPMSCTAGEEEKVIALGKRIDEVARQISASSGSIGEARILVMAALILTDRMSELEAKEQPSLDKDSGGARSGEAVDSDRLADVINSLASRVERLASGGASS